ncbi:MAG: glycosyltransferase [Symploca sp. SIO2E9]|nr:glycosyltransferase [Symploca sp. SIO2E9]
MTIKKVAILTHDMQGGAFTNLCTVLARGFQELGVNCDLVILHASNEEKAKYPDINLVTLNTRRTAFSLMPTVHYIRKYKPDVILPMPWYFNIVAIWARYLSRTNTKIIIGEHNIISLEAGIEHKDKLRLRYLPILMRYTYPSGDGLVGVSQDTITDLLEEIKVPDCIPMRVILNPIDIDRIQQLAREPIEHPWFQNKGTPVIMTVARLAKQKQLDVLIRAFANVVSILPAKLLILGEGPLRPELESLCRELQVEEHVAMPGYDHNPYRFMSACDAFVLASAWEGCPIALQEALACGAAAIVTNAPGGSKDVVGNGKFGIVVPTNDTDVLSKAIIQVLTDHNLKKHYREQASKRSQDFQYQRISREYLDFCNSV